VLRLGLRLELPRGDLLWLRLELPRGDLLRLALWLDLPLCEAPLSLGEALAFGLLPARGDEILGDLERDREPERLLRRSSEGGLSSSEAGVHATRTPPAAVTLCSIG